MSEERRATRQNVYIDSEGEAVRQEVLLQPYARTEIRKNFFSCRVVNSWNNLPSDVQGASCVQDFKQKYDDFISGN